MIRYFFRKITPVVLVFLAIVSLIPVQVVAAASNTVFLTPSSQGMNPGDSVTVQVKGNLATGSYIGANEFDGVLHFPANLLKVTGVSTSGTSFNWQATVTPNNTNGTVNFSEQSFFATDNTSVFMASITFQALSAGSAGVTWSSASYSYSGSTFPTSASGGTYSITNPTCPSGQVGTPPNCTTPPPPTCPSGQVGTPPNCTTPTCPSGQTGTPPNCTTPGCPTGQVGTPPNCTTPPIVAPSTPVPVTSSDATSTPQPDTTTPTAPIPAPTDNGLTISDATITRLYTSAQLTWKTSVASTGTVAFGTDIKTLDQKGAVTAQPDGSYSADLTSLAPGKRYYFTISAVSTADATKTSTYSGVFTTRGFPVSITVTEGGSPAANATLTLSGQTYRTDASGKLTMELASGSYSVAIKTAHGSKNVTLAVVTKPVPQNGTAPTTQAFTFDVPASTQPASSGGLSPFALLGIAVGVLGVLGLLFLGAMFLRRRKGDQDGEMAVASVDNDYTWAQQQPLPTMNEEANTEYPAMAQEMAVAPPPEEMPQTEGYETYDQQAPELMAAQNVAYPEPMVESVAQQPPEQAIPEPTTEYNGPTLTNEHQTAPLPAQEPIQEAEIVAPEATMAAAPAEEVAETQSVEPEPEPEEDTAESEETPESDEASESPEEDDTNVVVDQARGEITIEHHR